MGRVAFFFLVVLLVMMESATMALGSVASVGNQVGEPIKLHCKSRDDDFGEKTLLDQQYTGWGFTPNFWGTILYYCNFAWGARTLHLRVWDNDHDYSILHVVRQVRKDGFWMTAAGHTPFTFVAPWI